MHYPDHDPRAKSARQAKWRREHRREHLDHLPRVWTRAVDETGPHWALTVTTEAHTYVLARAAEPWPGVGTVA